MCSKRKYIWEDSLILKMKSIRSMYGKHFSDFDDINFNSYYKEGNLELIKSLWNGVKRGKLLNVF